MYRRTLVATFPEQNFGCRIWNKCKAKPLVWWTHTLLFELDIVIQNQMRHHRLQFICGEEPSRAAYRIKEIKTERCSMENIDSPSMLAMTERHILNRRANELVLQALPVLLTHTGEAPRVEDVRVRVIIFIQVRGGGRCNQHGTRRNDNTVCEFQILQSFPCNRDCTWSN